MTVRHDGLPAGTPEAPIPFTFWKRGKALQKRYLSIAILTAVLAVTGIAGYLLPAGPVAGDKEPATRRILFDNAGGPVVFDHQKHSRLLKEDCATCHHESLQKTPDKAMACASCHGVALDDAFKAGHAKSYPAESCVTCHHYELAAKDWGHQQHSEEFGVDCTSCHHADTDIEPEPQSFANCHEAGARPTNKAAEPGTPPVLADAVHARCVACHQDLFGKAKNCASCHELKPTRKDEAAVKGKVNALYADCTVCHVKKTPDKLIPGRMDAFLGQCMGCHEKLGKGPFGKDKCAQCHTK